MNRRTFIISLGTAVMGIMAAPAAFAAGPKILVAYYSKSGNTAAVARMIQQKTGADIFEIVPDRDYPRERPAAADIPRRERESGDLPGLKGALPDVAKYDVIIIGSPIWWYTLATPVMSFLQQVDLKGRTVAGFYTYAGSGKNFDADIQRLARNARVCKSIGFYGTYDTGRGAQPDGTAYQEEQRKETEEKLDAWLSEISR